MTAYPLEHFISDLEFVLTAAESEPELLEGAAPLVQRYATTPGWLEPAHYQWDDALGYGQVLLHQAANGGLNVWTGSWSPGGRVPPHDHGTWAIVVGMVGQERNVLWHRNAAPSGAGPAGLTQSEVRLIGPGDVLLLPSDAIHSVSNDGDEVSVSLHVYGHDLASSGRRQYDPETGQAKAIGQALD